MANLNGLITNLSGSAGAWTFYNRLGNTVAKQKVDTRPHRRLSDKQLAQNLRWPNLVTFWSETQGCLMDAFEHKRNGQTDFNMFMSFNLTSHGVYLTYEMARANACVVAPYLVSLGGLPPIEVVEAADGRVRTDIVLGDRLSVTPLTTIGELSHAIVQNNRDFLHGDIIYCLAMYQEDNTSDGFPHVTVGTALLRVDAYSSKPLSWDPNLMAAFANVEGHVGAESPIVGGITWIHARRLRTRHAVSTQRLFLSGTTDAPYTTPEAIAAAIKSYRPRIPAPAGQ